MGVWDEFCTLCAGPCWTPEYDDFEGTAKDLEVNVAPSNVFKDWQKRTLSNTYAYFSK